MSAILSPCGAYRYRLERVLADIGPVVAIIGVNPSTADAVTDDATIRKDLGFAHRHGWARIIKGNKFAFRSTDVRGLRGAMDPVGPDNDAHLAAIMRDADMVIAAWGPLGKLPTHLQTRWRAVARLARQAGKPLHAFGTAQDGHPRHTLMLAYETPLTPWQPLGAAA